MKKIYSVILVSLFFMACGSGNSESTIIATGVPEPAVMNYTVTNTYPHDTAAFTEGFEFHDGVLYESTGMRGTSWLSRSDLKTGKILAKVNLAKEFFGEGITILNGKIYQLTWEENKCFVYDSATLKKTGEFTYEGQGWGLTNDGKHLIMDNGNNNLYFRDPETFKITETVGVVDNNGGVSSINELEYVDGFIYSNVWMKDVILKIDPKSGRVVAKADFSGFKEKSFQGAYYDKADVLNGIAYDKANKRFLITGKYWAKVFEVKFN